MRRASDIVSDFRVLPFGSIDTITKSRGVMVLAPHPDDESLGCGGMIAELAEKGQPPIIVIVSDGTGSHPSSPTYPAPRLRALREKEALSAVSILGVPCKRLKFLGHPDTAIPSSGSKFESIVAEIEHLAREYESRILCAPWLHDPHRDHQAVQLIARAAAKSLGAGLLSYPVWGWLLGDHTQLPDTPLEGWRLDIQKYRERKRRAIEAHASQYSDLIDDDPNGFRLPSELLSVIDLPYEVFLHTL